jgi:ASC-1-like (ASCH) protein
MVEENDNEWTEEDLEFRKAFRNIPLHKIKEARARLERYVRLVYRIYEDIREDPEKYAEFQKRLEEIQKEESL